MREIMSINSKIDTINCSVSTNNSNIGFTSFFLYSNSSTENFVKQGVEGKILFSWLWCGVNLSISIQKKEEARIRKRFSADGASFVYIYRAADGGALDKIYIHV